MNVGVTRIAAAPVGVAIQMNVGGNDMQVAVTYAALGDDGIGEIANVIGRPAQDHGFQTGIVIQMNMQGRQAEIMVIMLALGQPARQLTFMMIEDLGQAADTRGRRAAVQPFALQFLANHITKGLGPVQIAVAGHECVKLDKKLVIKRYGNSFHGRTGSGFRL